MRILRSAVQTPSEVRSEYDAVGAAVRQVTVRHAAREAREELVVVTVFKLPVRSTSDRAGVLATSLTDASRAAVLAAASLSGHLGLVDRRLGAVLQDPDDAKWWNPTAIDIAGRTAHGRLHRLTNGFWAAIAEVDSAFVAVAGPPEIAPVPMLAWWDPPQETSP